MASVKFFSSKSLHPTAQNWQKHKKTGMLCEDILIYKAKKDDWPVPGGAARLLAGKPDALLHQLAGLQQLPGTKHRRNRSNT